LKTRDEIEEQIIDFIKKNFLFDEESKIGMDESLFTSGTIDSTGVMEVMAFVEQTYNFNIEDSELIAQNFETVRRITEFVHPRQGPRVAG
jgi:acyl carrier protein